MEVDPGLLRQHGRELGAELRMSVDARADGRAALRETRETRQHALQPAHVGADLRRPAAELLIEPHRHRIHQVRAAGLDDAGDLARLGLDRRGQMLERRQRASA